MPWKSKGFFGKITLMRSFFNHPARGLTEEKPLIYTAFSKHFFYYRMHISKYVIEKGAVPLNPFMLFDYFLLDTTDRDDVRAANNAIVMRADAVWVFGPISNGVFAEMLLAKERGIPLRYFQIAKPHAIIESANIQMESDMESYLEKATALLLKNLAPQQ